MCKHSKVRLSPKNKRNCEGSRLDIMEAYRLEYYNSKVESIIFKSRVNCERRFIIYLERLKFCIYLLDLLRQIGFIKKY